MAQEFKLPELGENIAAAGVVAVLVREGDTIAANTPVLEIETDKATVEVPCNVAGTISKIHVQAGQKASVGQVVLTLEETGAAAPPTVAATAPPAVAKPAPAVPRPAPADVDIKLPFLGDGIAHAKILQISVKVGDEVQADSPLLEIETDKTTVEVPGGQAGIVKEIHVKAGDKAQVGQVIATVSGLKAAAPPPAEKNAPPAEKKAPAPTAAAPALTRPKSGNGPARVSAPAAPVGKAAPASPTVRRLAREIGVDINQVKGSGPGGRISHDDVKAQARALLKRQASPASATGGVTGAPYIPVMELPDFTKFGTIDREPISGIRKKTAQQMALAWSTIPMVTQFDKADVTELEKLRTKLDVKARQQGNKLTVTAILLRIVASALKRFPKFNASLDLAKEEVVFKKYYNVGVAVDTERGLLVPVVREVDRKNVFELSAALQELAEKARNRKVTPDDLQGSCFTITNLGGIGGHAFTPIVNPPEVAILGVSRSSTEAVWQDSGFVPRTLLPLSLSYDHRLIDGAEAARFLRFVCDALENPALLIFEG